MSASISFHGAQKAASGLSSLDMRLIGGLVALLVLAAIGWYLAFGRRRGPSADTAGKQVTPLPPAEGTGGPSEEETQAGETSPEPGKDGRETSEAGEPSSSSPPPPPPEAPSAPEPSAGWENPEPPAPAPPAPH